jgi:hypothetical protein
MPRTKVNTSRLPQPTSPTRGASARANTAREKQQKRDADVAAVAVVPSTRRVGKRKTDRKKAGVILDSQKKSRWVRL